jgi:ceroid-lipofuscinosis MFS transporter 7
MTGTRNILTDKNKVYLSINTQECSDAPVKDKRMTQWRLQMFLINLVEFSAESSRGVVLPTLFLYCESLGGDLAAMGMLTSIFSIGRLISSTVFGWMCDRYSFRAVYIASSLMGLLGNLIYMMADDHVFSSFHVLLLSRFVVGFGAGNRSVCRANVAAMTRVDQRLKYLTILAMVVFLGYALTPGLGGLMTDLDMYFLGLHLHALTVPGLMLAGLNMATIFLMVFVYDESIDSHDAPDVSTKAFYSKKMTSSDQDHEEIIEFDLSDRLAYGGVFVFMTLNVVARGILSIFETIIVPLFLQCSGKENLNTTSNANEAAVENAAAFQFYLGCLGLLSYLAIEVWHHKIHDIAWLLIGFAAMVLGNTVLAFNASTSNNFDSMAIGVFFVWSIGSPLTTAVCVVAFSKILGPRKQGMWMGLLGSASSISRVILPLLPALFSTFTSVFWLNVLLSTISIALLLWYDAMVKRAKDAAFLALAVSP